MGQKKTSPITLAHRSLVQYPSDEDVPRIRNSVALGAQRKVEAMLQSQCSDSKAGKKAKHFPAKGYTITHTEQGFELIPICEPMEDVEHPLKEYSLTPESFEKVYVKHKLLI